ncbi:MAG TPA: methyltransferase domain-containing protein [Terriglobales bacterium]|nr:methyltransferase domain-containing protein [Terriglobales bacterium]
MSAEAVVTNKMGLYVCPACKGGLHEEGGTIRCISCSRTYPIMDGIPDFLGEELARSADPVLRRMRFIDRMARIYETKLWYPVVLNLYGGIRSPSLRQLIHKVTEKLQSTTGSILDVACGPGTYGRRVASAKREVYGIDVSMGMLRQGHVHVAQEGICNMHFARARVEVLPFRECVFDATICCGSLHLFADTVVALREMARVMKPGALLSVFTFDIGDGGILKFSGVRDWSRKRHGLHIFGGSEMEQYLTASGFRDFEPELNGSILTFSARRQNT